MTDTERAEAAYVSARRQFRNAIGDALEIALDNFMNEPGDDMELRGLVFALASNILHYLPYLKDFADEMDAREIEGGVKWQNLESR